MKEIPLTQGRVTLVDDEDYQWLSTLAWCWMKDSYCSEGRAVRGIKINGVAKLIYMSIQIAKVYGEIPQGFVVDHVNGKSLDNRKENLRVCSQHTNRLNSFVYNSSGFRGVRKKASHYYAQIKDHGKTRMLGSFTSAEEAAKAFDEAAWQLHGNVARLNFPRTK